MAKEKTTTSSDEQDFSFLNADDNSQGFEKIGMTEQAIPFIRIAQQLSPQVTSGHSDYIEGLKSGQLFNTVTKEVYGDGLKIIAGGFDHVYIEWPPERNQGGPVAYHTPEVAEQRVTPESKKIFGKWVTADGNKLVETYMYYVLVVGQEAEGIAVLSLKSSDISIAKKWNRRLLSTLMPNGVKAKPHYLIWDLGTTSVTNDKGTWSKLAVDFGGYVTKHLYEAISAERLSLPNVSSLDLRQLDGPGGTDSSVVSDKKQETAY